MNPIQEYDSFILNPIRENKWTNIQTNHAKTPLKWYFGKSTTALFLPMVAIEPLSL
jgi:hypothetical protein